MTPQIRTRIDQIRRGEVPEGYKKTKVGIVPEEWECLSIDKTYKERKEHGKEELPVLSVSIHTGVSDGELDDDELGKTVKRIEDKTQYLMARPGDLVFNMMRAWQGAIGVVKTTGLVSPAYIVADPNQERVFPPFMDDYMKSPQMVNMIHRQSYGVTDFRLRLYWDSFAKIETAIPPLAEQEKIAEILATQDKVIALKEKLLEEKKKQKKYLMQQLLTGKKRLPGFSGEWEKDKIGKYLSESAIVATPNINKRITVKLHLEGICQRDIKAIEKEEATTQYCRKAGQFIYGKQNFHNGAFGIIPKELDGYQSSSDLPSFDISNQINKLWFFYYCSMSDFYRKLEITSTGTGSKRTNPDTFLHLEIPFPSKEEQEAIAEVLSNADSEISIIQESITQEKKKKKALMQLLLTGIVRCNI